jgi:drug/metabolite transporter (DMT)-like permease
MNKVTMANIGAAGASLIAGISIVATRFVIVETDPMSLAFFRYLIAFFCLLPFLQGPL